MVFRGYMEYIGRNLHSGGVDYHLMEQRELDFADIQRLLTGRES